MIFPGHVEQVVDLGEDLLRSAVVDRAQAVEVGGAGLHVELDGGHAGAVLAPVEHFFPSTGRACAGRTAPSRIYSCNNRVVGGAG